mgnify:CR=1 FL=1
MVHVFCLDKECRRVLHLESSKYWNFKGKVKCLHCGVDMEIEVKEGKLVSTKAPETT